MKQERTMQGFAELTARARGGAIDPRSMVEAAISEAGGDPRAAVLALLRVNEHLLRENRRLGAAASTGFTRGGPRNVEAIRSR
jgi:hypothetical protein